MRYYKAQEITAKPFIIWCEFAGSLEELERLGLENDPLIKPENEVPNTQFGVCPYKIVSGELVERSSTEMDAYELEYTKETAIANEVKKASSIESLTFDYDGHTFPTHASARVYYQILDKYRVGGSRNVMDVDGTIYALSVANFDDFLTEYYKVMLAELEP